MHVPTSGQAPLDLGFGGYSCNWGTHFAGLYRTEEERDEIILGFLNRGDLDGDLQLYCPTERSAQDFRKKYGQEFPDCAGHTDDPERFRLLSARDLYYPEGAFSPGAMDHSLSAFFVESQKEGQRNIRAAAEMSWALEAVPGIEHLMVYESRLNDFIPGKPWISICLYNISKFSGDIVMNVLRTHPYTISGGVITENPYYQDPDEWLARNAPASLHPPDRALGVQP